MKTLAIVISILSFAVSGATAWFTVFRRGRLRITRPNIIAFTFDGPNGPPKIFLRALLFSTSRGGHVIETMYLKLKMSKTTRVYSDWGYGDDKLMFGSGLHVPFEGLVTNHHFLLPKNNQEYAIAAGEYTIELYAKVVTKNATKLVFETTLSLDDANAQLLNNRDHVIFTWDPIQQRYTSSSESSKKFRVLFAV